MCVCICIRVCDAIHGNEYMNVCNATHTHRGNAPCCSVISTIERATPTVSGSSTRSSHGCCERKVSHRLKSENTSKERSPPKTSDDLTVPVPLVAASEGTKKEEGEELVDRCISYRRKRSSVALCTALSKPKYCPPTSV